eukprot:jgi/Undpi1/8342/HiC_scaffold_25.g10811.m1
MLALYPPPPPATAVPLALGEGRVRDYLNGLVSETAALTSNQLCNIAFVKTHKTASTTLAYLLFRYGRRHHKKIANFDDHNSAIPLSEAVTQTKQGKGRVDIMHYHMSVFGQYDGTWNEAEDYYRRIMRDSERVNFVSVVREPRNHLLSGDIVHSHLFNPLSAEFGVSTRGAMENLVADVLPRLKLVILTEEFDEGLMVLRRLLGWSMIDMTYSSMYKTAKGAKRFDGKQLVDVPHFDDLPQQTRDIIDDITQLDQMLYVGAKKEYEKRRDSVAAFLGSDLAEFNELQSVVSSYLETNSSSKANAMYKTINIYANEERSPLYEF